jgi:hypothetical protein
MADGGLDNLAESRRVYPYTLPAERHGWRGLGVEGNHKRKVYTLLHNEQVLVTALVLLPGERSIRHSHESGELSVHYLGDMRPEITWNAPGVLHGGAPPTPAALDEALRAAAPDRYSNPEVAQLARQIEQLQAQIRELQARLEQATRAPAPFVIVDVLFPPFKTTIDDDAVPEKRTVVGQWYD